MTFHYFYPTSPNPPTPPSPLPATFTLSAPPGTDIWRKPPHLDSFNAPILYRTLALSSFRRARVSISAEWKTRFDQGGLCLILPPPHKPSPATTTTTTTTTGERKWLKTGIEFFHGGPHVSTVACDRWADWSLVPAASGTAVTVEMEREFVHGEPTSTLWVYIVEGLERRPVREVTWVFDEADGECWVGVYAAKPTKDQDDGERALEVEFGNLLVETV